jgi:hypothetical protein
VADGLERLGSRELGIELAAIRSFLVEELLPHDRAEDATIYPEVARLLGGDDPTGTMSRAHLEIAHRVRLFGRLIEELPPAGPEPEDLVELRRLLYGLHAILQLHIAQEEESYLSLLEAQGGPEPVGRGSTGRG